jgi:hypothetical protein
MRAAPSEDFGPSQVLLLSEPAADPFVHDMF